MYTKFKKIEDNNIQEAVNGVAEWAKLNKMELNDGKCKSIIFNSKVELTPILLNEREIEVVDEYKYLGFYLNKGLNWDKQVQEIISRTGSTIYLLKQLNNQALKKKY
jgi:hypothetical protein